MLKMWYFDNMLNLTQGGGGALLIDYEHIKHFQSCRIANSENTYTIEY